VAPLGSVTVTRLFCCATSSCSTGTTSSNGQVSLTRGSYKSGRVTFCVTHVTGGKVTQLDSTGGCKTH
jgi:hypothetical protein